MVDSVQRKNDYPKADLDAVDTPILESARTPRALWPRVRQVFAHLSAQRQSTPDISNAGRDLDVCEHTFVDATFSKRAFPSSCVLATRRY
jgi:hypothetical protein